jgi:hypothetical protein
VAGIPNGIFQNDIWEFESSQPSQPSPVSTILLCRQLLEIAKIAKPTVETSDKVRLNLEKFVWSSREK